MSTLKVINILNPSAGNIAMVTDILGNTAVGGNVGLGTGGGNISFNGSALVIGTQNALPIQFRTSGSQQMVITSTGNVGVGTATPLQLLHVQGGSYFTSNVGIGSSTPQQSLDVQGNVNVLNTVIMGSSFLRNRIINGGMAIDQRNSGASQTITAGAALAYTVDRFYAYCTGANVTGSRIANSTNNPANNPSQYAYQFAGAASVTGIGFGTRIEAINCWDLAGTTATLSVNLANGLLTTVTWTASYANSTDSFGSLASPTVTQIATGTFTVNASLSRYSVSIPIPIAATTGIQIVFTVGAQTSQTWQINNVQLEPGPVATPFERKLFDQILIDCQRYYEKSYDVTVVPGTVTSTNAFSLIASSSLVRYPAFFKVTKRIVNGTITFYSTTGASGNIRNNSAASDLAVSTVTGSVNGYASSNGGTTNNEYIGQWTIDAEY